MKLAPLFFLFLLQDAAFDYSKIDRAIGTQPKYVAEPQYALLLLGDGKARFWMVLDKSAADKEKPDVLYFDRDGDGNLGEEGEKVLAVPEENGMVMNVGKVEVKEPKFSLDEFTWGFYDYDGALVTTMSFRMNGKVTVSGMHGPSTEVFKWGPSPAKAPILRADPFGTLAFHHTSPSVMKIGRSTEFQLYVGTPGSGPATFLTVDEEFLDLEKDKLFATVIAKDAKGNEIRKRSQLKEHC